MRRGWLCRDCGQRRGFSISGPSGRSLCACHFFKYPIDHTHVKVHRFVQAGAEAVNKGHCADVQVCLVRIGCARAMGLQALCNDPQEDAQHHIERGTVALHEVAQALRDGEHPLAHWKAREYVIVQVSCGLHHAPGAARGADTTAFAGEGDKVVVAAVIAAGAGKAVREDAARQL